MGTITVTTGELQVNAPIWTEQSDFYGSGNSGGESVITRPVARDEGLGSLGIGFEGSDFLRGNFSSFEITIVDTRAEGRSKEAAERD